MTGQTGVGLILLSAGRVRITQHDGAGHSAEVVEHFAGQFLGEVSGLSGRPALVILPPRVSSPMLARMTPARPNTVSRGGTTRNELKRAARRLFATRGIAAVGMREVVEAAGQRNAAAVHYYFGSKDDLLRELVIDGAKLLDEGRKALLDAAETRGAVGLRDVVRAMTLPNIDLVGETGEEETYFRFIVGMQNERRDLFAETVRGKHSEGYARCMAHVHRLLPALPTALVNQRLLFAGLSLQTLIAAREAALDASDTGDHHFWSRPDALEGILDAVEAVLTGPVSTAPADQKR